MDDFIMNIICENGVSLDGKSLINDNGMLRFQIIDWDKTNQIVKQKIIEYSFGINN